VLGGESNVVGGAGLVSIRRTPDHAVGKSPEVTQHFYRLMRRTVFSWGGVSWIFF